MYIQYVAFLTSIFHQFLTSLQIGRLEDQLASKTTALQQLVMGDKSVLLELSTVTGVQHTTYFVNVQCHKLVFVSLSENVLLQNQLLL